MQIKTKNERKTKSSTPFFNGICTRPWSRLRAQVAVAARGVSGGAATATLLLLLL